MDPFSNFVDNLSSTLTIGKMSGGFYDMHISRMREMQEHQRRAHISSMKHSQKSDYQCDLRLVLTEQDDLRPGADPWALDSYTTPGIEHAKQAATEIVIRRDGREIKVKG